MDRRKIQILMLVFLFSPMLPLKVSAHSLEWGIEVGEEFIYALQRKTGDQVAFEYISTVVPFIMHLDEGQKVSARFTQLDAIPTEINATSREPLAYCDLTRLNDSEVIVVGSNGFAAPNGNWSLIQELRNITVENGFAITDTDELWGYYASGVYPGSSDVSVYQEVVYEKVNGTLTFYRWSFSRYGETLLDIVLGQWHPGDLTILPEPADLSGFLIMGIGICLAVVCGFLTFKGCRKRGTIMEELGK